MVVCSFGLSDIDNLDGAIAAISAPLRPRGSFSFSILHPCFAGGKDISGSWPTTGSYYDEGRWTAQDPFNPASPGRSKPPDAIDLSRHAPAARPMAGTGRGASSGTGVGQGARC